MLHSHAERQCTHFSSISRDRPVPRAGRTPTRRRGAFGSVLGALAALVALGGGPAPVAATAPVKLPQSFDRAATDPTEACLWWILFFLGFDESEIVKATVSPTAAMTAIQIHYTLFGVPSNLSPADRAALLQNIDVLYCSLSTTPPAGVNELTLQMFLSTLKSMWADLGANPNDLGC